MNQEKIEYILREHQLWLQTRFSPHIEGCRADLRGVNLMNTDLRGADLRDADLRGADLKYANLRSVNLMNADLKYADLRSVNLMNADLRGADLKYANLRSVNLMNTDLRGADLRSVNLMNADLIGADLRGALLFGADLRGVKNTPFIPFACPDSGSFIGYKKANDYIVKLEILADARRCSSTGRKCRCDKARVLSITNLDGTDGNISSISSNYDDSFVYTIGEVVEVPDFDTNRWNECSSGIHFFINRQEAVDY